MSHLSDFHFIRPLWLLALPAAILVGFLLYRHLSLASSWKSAIDPDLAQALLVQPKHRPTMNPIPLLVLTWIISTLALAGPTWQKVPQPILEREDALVIILDLTWSMYSSDVAPNRLTNAKRKITDLLKGRDEGVTALVVFAGDAHAVSPLTDDTKTILAMLPALGPEIMPAPGSSLAPALARAEQLFASAEANSGQVLIITDEIRDPGAALAARRNLGKQFSISIMAVGTEAGAPIKLPAQLGDTFMKDARGNLIIPQLAMTALETFANESGADIKQLDLLSNDIEQYLEPPVALTDTFRLVDRDFDLWREFGPYLIFVLVPLVLAGFRRGWLWLLPLMVILPSDQAIASTFWEDLWSTRDQQGQALMQSGDPAAAAERFEDPLWRSTALYRSDDYPAAAESFSSLDSELAHYNRGNALARAGDLQGAIDAYETVLEFNQDHADAQFNKDLVEQLLEQQEQASQQSSEEDPSDDQNSNDNSQNDSSQQNDQSSEDEEESSPQSSQSEPEEGDNSQEEEEEASQASNNDADEAAPEEQASLEEAALTDEEAQALDQWLKRVPDDPGGLLRRKFEQQFETRVREGEITQQDFERNW